MSRTAVEVKRKEWYALNMTLPRTWSSVIWTWPTATPKQRTFFNWNLMVERTSVSLVFRSSACDTGVGNLPAIHMKVLCYTLAKERMQIYLPFERPGPKRRGICLMRDSEARKASYFLASFLTNFLFLFNLQSIYSARKFKLGKGGKRTSSNHRRTCTPNRFASHDRYRRHLRECRWTCEDGGHWAIYK